MENLVFIKLGGSLITDKAKPFTEKGDAIKRLAREIHEARKESGVKIILGHGGGSYPHKPAHDYQIHKGVKGKESYKGMALVQDAASRLNRIVVEALIEAGENAVTVQPSSCTVADKGRIVEFYTKSIEMILEYDMLPVVYGDLGFDKSQGSCILSTEEILRFLAGKFKPDKIIMAGKTDGVFTADPNKNSGVKPVPVVSSKNIEEVRGYLEKSDGIDVTGGMVVKVNSMLELADKGTDTQIINGNTAGNLKQALLGKEVKGTLITK